MSAARDGMRVALQAILGTAGQMAHWGDAELDVWVRQLEMARGASSLRAPQSGPGLNLSAVNLARCTAPDGFNHPLASWSAAEWTNAVAGEAGEACNLAKKLIRHRDGVPGNKKPEDLDQDSLRRRIAEELADVVIYCDLAMASVGYDFATVVREVFNRKSQELGSPYVVAGSGAETPPQPPPIYVYNGPHEGFKVLHFPELPNDRAVVLGPGDTLELRWGRAALSGPPEHPTP